MKKEIAVVNSDKKQCQALCNVLGNRGYRAIPINSLSGLEKYHKASRCRTVIIDLDNLPMDKHFFRDLKTINPSLCIMGLSARSFHPELEEAISHHIYACLKKPVEPEELIYLLKSIYENNANLENQTKT